jgi:hypothetical protein
MPSKYQRESDEPSSWVDDVEEETYQEEEDNNSSSEDEFDDFDDIIHHWPGDRVARPPVSFLVKHHVPLPVKPEPADPATLERYNLYIEQVKQGKEKKEKLKTQVEAKSQELLKAEAQPVTYANKWSDKAKGSGRDALIKRLEGELAVIQKQFDEASFALMKIENDKANKSLVGYIAAVEHCHAMFDEYVKKEREGWIKLYGPHTPINKISQLKRYYSAEITQTEDGMILAKFPDDLQVGQAFRELKLGGHEYIRRLHWDTLEMVESAFVKE